MEIKIERAKTLKEKPDQNNLGFGTYFTDHMFMMDILKELVGTMLESFHMLLSLWIQQQWYYIMLKRHLKD